MSRRNLNQSGAVTDEAVTSKAKLVIPATTSTKVVGKAKRSKIIISPGAKDVWLALGPAAALSEGIFLSKEAKTPLVIEGWSGEIFAFAAEEVTITWVDF